MIVEEPTEIYPPPRIERLATLKVEEADKGPANWRELEMVEEALLINPVSRCASPATVKVLEAETGPETFRLAVIVEDPTEMKPPDKVARLVADKLPEVTKLLEKVPKPADKPAKVDVPVMSNLPEPTKFPEKVPKPADSPAKVEVPATPKVSVCNPPAKVEVPVPTIILSALTVEEAVKAPATFKVLAMVEEAEEIKPFPMVSIPVVEALTVVIVPVAVKFAKVRFPEINALPCTDKSWEGEVVPKPSLPRLVSMR